MKKATALKSNKNRKLVKTNSQTIRRSSPKSTTTSKSFRVRHREMLGSLDFETGDNSSFLLEFNQQISPSDPDTFPWLSTIARNFEYYRFSKLSFSYVPRCSVMESGSVCMAIDYDVADSPPVHMEDLQLYMGAVPFAVYERATLVADPRSLSLYPYRYLRVLSQSQDARLEVVGRFYVGLSTASVATFGDFYVDYDVEFFAPQFAEPAGSVCLSALVHSTNSTSPLPGVASSLYQKGGISIQTNAADHTTIGIPNDGKYLLNYLAPSRTIPAQPSELYLSDPNNIIRAANLITALSPSLTETTETQVIQALLDLEPSRKGSSEGFFDLYFTAAQPWVNTLAGILTVIKVGDSFIKAGPVWTSSISSNGIKTFVCKLANAPHECESIGSTSVPNHLSNCACSCTSCTRTVATTSMRT